MPLTPAALLDHLSADAGRMVALAHSSDLSAPVPSCPGWTAADLVGHLGSVYRWATEVLRTGAVAEQGPAPDDVKELASWFAGAADQLIDTLQATDPSQPCWGFGPPPRLAGFWFRRQALETSIHLWDARACLGQDTAIDPELAQDGVEEVVSVLFPRQVRLGRIEPLAGAVALRVADTSRTWVLGGDGVAAPGKTLASVTGPAVTLFLLVWRRVGLGSPQIQVDGDVAAAGSVLAAALTP
jgi:uncharacterized protein (TIGR03083 family)